MNSRQRRKHIRAEHTRIAFLCVGHMATSEAHARKLCPMRSEDIKALLTREAVYKAIKQARASLVAGQHKERSGEVI